MMPEVVVLRYGHRPIRDERVTTHCCLVARAFGADEITIIGNTDENLKKRIEKVVKNWGGRFKVDFKKSWLEEVRRLKEEGFSIVHLTMYGKPLEKIIEDIRKHKKIAIIVGSKKVEPNVYIESDYNICVTKQPHSEIAALAVFLDWYFDGSELSKAFAGAKMKATEKKFKKTGGKNGF
ncbi:MAG: tRNA (cytidine(56)-2'-O)-methyltransferase [Candidatus Diapherotrites archaeon]|nr:tRNA (cytidine(56)-2'-O)-methyltransferase [Candidatus Diapherotrites archaeon]